MPSIAVLLVLLRSRMSSIVVRVLMPVRRSGLRFWWNTVCVILVPGWWFDICCGRLRPRVRSSLCKGGDGGDGWGGGIRCMARLLCIPVSTLLLLLLLVVVSALLLYRVMVTRSYTISIALRTM